MADAFLTSDLHLDVRAALQQVDRLNEALNRATTGIIVTADVRQVTASIDAAVDAADSLVTIASDTSQVAGEITAAVDAADSAVAVTGDASSVTASIDAAVEAADTSLTVTANDQTGTTLQNITRRLEGLSSADKAIVITANIKQAEQAVNAITRQLGDDSLSNAEVRVLVDSRGEASRKIATLQSQLSGLDDESLSIDGQVSPGLRQGVDSLGDSIDAATTSGINLKSILAALAATGAVAGLRKLADAGSDLAESTSKAATVFGDEFKDIEAFANGAADSVGLTKQAALEATGTFGNLFQALGTSREEAAKLSPEVVQLAGDLASFNNLGVDEALEKLRSGLVGEIEPLRSLGVSFLAADVTAKALELGLGGVNGELTEGEKVQARYALIVEQTSLASGDFARTAEGLANQQRILSAELGNAAAAAGTLLLPAFLAIGDAARDALPGLSQLGEDVLPAVSDALVNLAPLIGTSVDLLLLLAPIITVVAEALAAIPSGAIAAGAGLLITNRAFGVLDGLVTGLGPALASVPGILRGVASATPAAASGVGSLSAGVQGLAAGVAALNPLTIAAGVFAVGLFSAWQQGKEAARDYREELDQLTSALETVDGFQQLTTRGIATYVEEQSRINTKDQVEDLNRLGISYGQIADFAQRGARGQLDFVDALVEGGDLTRVTRDEYGELVTATGRVIGANSDLGKSLEDVGVGYSDLVVGNTGLVTSYSEIASVTEDVAKRQIGLLQAEGLLTDAQVRTALGTNASGEATIGYAEALNNLEPLVVAAARAAEQTIAKYEPLAAIFLDTGEALASLTDTSPAAALAIAAVANQGADPTAESLLSLAVVLDGAKLSEEQMAEAALALGTDIGTLQGFIDTTSAALSDFVDTAVGGLPTVADAFQDANNDSSVSAQEFINGLLLETTRMSQFIADLAVIVEAGFVEVAGVLSEKGVEAAGLAASELANAAREGNTALLLETQAGLDQRDAAIAFSTEYLSETLGPEYIAATGQVGSLSSEALAAMFTPEEQTRIKMELAGLELDKNGKAVAFIAATVGAEEARKYGEALTLDERTVEEAVKAGAAIKANAPTVAGFEAGDSVGGQVGDGMAYGLDRKKGAVAEAARALVRNALTAAEIEARVESPSKVTTRLGELIGEGFVVGLRHSVAAVAAEAAAVADAALVELPPLTLGVDFDREAAAAAVAEAERIVSSLHIPALDVQPVVQVVDPGVGLDGAPGGGGVSVTIAAGAITVNAPAGMTREQGVEVGEGIADGMERRLVERRLSVLSRAT